MERFRKGFNEGRAARRAAHGQESFAPGNGHVCLGGAPNPGTDDHLNRRILFGGAFQEGPVPSRLMPGHLI